MKTSKGITLILISFLFAYSLAEHNLLTQENQLFTVQSGQVMMASMMSSMTSNPSLLMTAPLQSLCGNNQVQNTAHVCIKPEYIQGCETYQTSSACSQCSTGYSLNKDKRCSYMATFTGIVAHVKGCIKQSSDICVVCAQGFYKKQNKCILGVINCASYNTEGECIQCERDFSLILSQCRKNSLLGCKYETDSHTCTECYAPFTLNEQHCDIEQCRILNDYGCVACECGFHLTAERDCRPISPGCLRYEKGLCKDCLPHYKLKGSVCEIQGCLEYSGNYCRKCSDDYELVEGECKFKNCVDWLNDQCVICREGFGLRNGHCVTATTVSCQ